MGSAGKVYWISCKKFPVLEAGKECVSVSVFMSFLSNAWGKADVFSLFKVVNTLWHSLQAPGQAQSCSAATPETPLNKPLPVLMKAGLIFDSSNFFTVLMSLCKKVEFQEVVWPLEFGPGYPQQLERLSTLLQALKGCNFKNPKPPLKVPLEFTKAPYFNTSFWMMLVVFPHSSFSTY